MGRPCQGHGSRTGGDILVSRDAALQLSGTVAFHQHPATDPLGVSNPVYLALVQERQCPRDFPDTQAPLGLTHLTVVA